MLNAHVVGAINYLTSLSSTRLDELCKKKYPAKNRFVEYNKIKYPAKLVYMLAQQVMDGVSKGQLDPYLDRKNRNYSADYGDVLPKITSPSFIYHH